MKNRILFSFITVAILLGLSTAALASLTVVSVLNGTPGTQSGTNYVNFDSVTNNGGGNYTAPNYSSSATPLGSITVNITPNAMFVTGSVGGQYAAPYIGASNAGAMNTYFGNANVAGQDATQYITTGSTGNTAGAQAELIFGAGQSYLGLLWGSVDSNPLTYNVLTFYFDDNTTDTITGADVSLTAGGNQGATGTYYVNIDSTKTFNKVVATSSQFAFEFDNVAYSTSRIIPEASTIAIWSALSLIGFGSSRKGKRLLVG